MVGAADGDAGQSGNGPPLIHAERHIPSAAPAGAGEGTGPDDERHHGLFGPGSITWRVHSDPLIGLATLSSLALRVLHPQGMGSVFATAERVDDPWDRLTWTLRYLGVVTFGNSTEAMTAGARMRAVLGQIHGVQDGRAFRGDDPELLRWMHCCQVQSFLEVTRRAGLELSERDREVYLGEQVQLAALLGLEPDQVPSTRAEMIRYFRGVRPQLRMTAPGRAFIGELVAPTMPELLARTLGKRPPWSSVGGLAYACLPTWARALYGRPSGCGPATLSASATTLALHSLRDSLRGIPDQTGAGSR